MLAYLLPYLAVNGMYQRVYERFLLPVLPIAATFIAWSLGRIASDLGRRRAQVARVLTVLLVAAPAAVAWRLTDIRRAPSTQTQAAAWLEGHAQPSDRILVTRDLRLPLTETVVSEVEGQGDVQSNPAHDRVHWTEYQVHVLGASRPEPAWNLVWMPVVGAKGNLLQRMDEDPAWYVDQRYGDFLVAMLFTNGRIAPGLEKVHEEFRRRGESLAVFTPDGGVVHSGHPLAYQDETCPGNVPFAWRVWNAERMGPVIEILRPPHREPPAKRD